MKHLLRCFFYLLSDELLSITDKVFGIYDEIHRCYDVSGFTTFIWVYTTNKDWHNMYFIFLQYYKFGRYW